MVILIIVFCVAVYMDLRFYKIPNLCIFTGIVSGLIMTTVSYSVAEMLIACVTMAAIFAAFYPFYLMGALGAGDVKLLMMTGCFIQCERIIQYLLVTFIAAAVISAVKIALFQESRERVWYFGRYLKKAVITGNVEAYIVNRTNKRCVIRLSVPAFVSLVMMCMGVY
ncbi:MAG: prepilin peptidase [Lachnospiraceae bacterium]|nr:prepilin peptidase [Lachnospiraceae bacterium]